VVSDESGVKTIYVDASAGGQQAAPENPRVYLDLVAGARVDLTDPEARTATTWDLSLKRSVIFVNGGDGGPGQGGSVFLAGKSFDEVTQASADALEVEDFFSEDCIANLDPMQAVKTTFSDWYNYNEATHQLTPKAGVFVVRGAGGAFFKVEILGYYGKPDGALNGMAGGRFVLKTAAL
jgi:hypothetical protein